jgi:micrococcal nuclease
MRASCRLSSSFLAMTSIGGWILLVLAPTRSNAFSSPCSASPRAYHYPSASRSSFRTTKQSSLTENNSQTIHRLRGGSTTTTATTTTALEAARKASSSAIQTVWKHPWMQAVWAWMVALWKTTRGELQRLNPNQRWIMAAVFLLGIQLGRSLSSLAFTRFKDAVDIPTQFFGPSAPCLTGRAVSVTDGDTLRFYHRPTPFHTSTFDKKKQKLSETTLPIRICSIDAPETSKFGKPGQKFGAEAKQELQNMVEHKLIQVRLLSKDQYGRAVGQVFVPRRLPLSLFQRQKGVDEILLQAGLAEVYQGMGAVYGTKGKEAYLQMEEAARKAKKGMWSQKKRESAAEYKRRTK